MRDEGLFVHCLSIHSSVRLSSKSFFILHPSALIPSEVERERVLGGVAADGEQREVVNVFSVELRDSRENVVAVLVEGRARRVRAACGVKFEVRAGRVAETFVRIDLNIGRMRDGDELQSVNEESLFEFVRHANLVTTV